METYASASWHDAGEINRLALAFHEKYAGQLIRKYDEARTTHDVFTREMETYFRTRNVCVRLEHIGSSYEGVRVPQTADDNDMKFQLLAIMVRWAVLAPLCWPI